MAGWDHSRMAAHHYRTSIRPQPPNRLPYFTIVGSLTPPPSILTTPADLFWVLYNAFTVYRHFQYSVHRTTTAGTARRAFVAACYLPVHIYAPLR